MRVNNLENIYEDYLIASTGQVCATGVSSLLDGDISHDSVTRLLKSGIINSQSLWQRVKPMCHEVQNADGVLIFDDSIEEKKYTDTNDLIQWHFDHTQGRCVKGVNFITALYHSSDVSLPVSIDFVLKTESYINKKGKLAHKSKVSKNEMYRTMLQRCSHNLRFKYVLNDSWFSSAENMGFVVLDCKKQFIMAMKENRKVALSKEDKALGKYTSIKSLELEECVWSVYVEQLDFPILLTKQVFKNGDGSTGILYLASSDLNLSFLEITTIYKKRWKVEEYHKSIKSNTAFAKSPTRTVITQMSHFISSIKAYVKLELLKIRLNKNHFATKAHILLEANKQAYKVLQSLLTPNFAF